MTVLGLKGRCSLSVRALAGALGYWLDKQGCRCLVGRADAAAAHLSSGRSEPLRLSCGAPVDLLIVLDARGIFIPKIEVWREGHGGPLVCDRDPSLLAIAADGLPPDAPVPILDFCDPEAAAAFVAGWLRGMAEMTAHLGGKGASAPIVLH